MILEIEFEEEQKELNVEFDELYTPKDGKNPYDYAVAGGYTGTEEEFIAQFIGMLEKELPSKTETLKFTLEDGSVVEMAVYVK